MSTTPIEPPGVSAAPSVVLPEPGTADSALELRNASRWYGNVVAVNDISFSLRGGITGLLGANGAGKSTVLHMGAGLLRPSAGEVLVAGEPAWRNPSVYSTIGLVPEREAVQGFLTGYEFVLVSARLHGLRDPADAARRAIRMVELDDARNRRIDTYSKGMRQRAKIAAALVHEPRILLLDEPFNGLDPRQRMQMTLLLQDIADEGRTVVFSSHILEEVEQLASSVLVLVSGRLAASGPPREIRRLMTQRPHTFRLRSSDDRVLAAILIADPSVVGIEITAKGTTVRAGDRLAFTRALPRLARDGGVSIYELQPLDESLESIFSYLVRS